MRRCSAFTSIVLWGVTTTAHAQDNCPTINVFQAGLRIFAIVPLLLLGAFPAQGICAAQVFSSAMDHEALDEHLSAFKGASNLWRTKPVDISSQVDTALADIRALRDAFWDSGIGSEGSLLDPATRSTYFPNLSGDGDYRLSLQPEFPNDPSLVWVIGRFENYHSYLSGTEKSIYTEIDFKVEEAIGAAGPGLKPGAIITLESAGGTVKTKNGVVLSYAIAPRQDALVPNGVYLLQVTYYPKEEFFLVDRQWDVSSGKAVPLTALERAREQTGQSLLAGMSTPEISRILRHKYPTPSDRQWHRGGAGSYSGNDGAHWY